MAPNIVTDSLDQPDHDLAFTELDAATQTLSPVAPCRTGAPRLTPDDWRYLGVPSLATDIRASVDEEEEDEYSDDDFDDDDLDVDDDDDFDDVDDDFDDDDDDDFDDDDED